MTSHRLTRSAMKCTVFQIRRMLLSSVLLLASLLAVAEPTPASAVCHGSSSFMVSSGSQGLEAAGGQEVSKVGVCNNNGGYQSSIRKTSGPASACFVVIYYTSLGVYTTNCVSSSSWQNGSVIVGDPDKNAPMYFCPASIGGLVYVCTSGPWSNYGY